jgi:hypothetical protein
VFGSSKFFVKWGLADDDVSISSVVMRVALSMSSGFHTPIDFWLELSVPDLYAWTMQAKAMREEEKSGNA